MSEWKPIAEIDTDGRVLVCHHAPGHPYTVLEAFRRSNGTWYGSDNRPLFSIPTHFRHRPPPPEDTPCTLT